MNFDPVTYALAKSYSDSKGGYTEPGKKLFTIELTDGQYLDATRKSGSLEVGKTYTVAVDGETYTCKGKDGAEVDADVCLGNFGLAGGTDTGEPFFVLETFDSGTDNVWVLAAMTNNGASTISVSIADTTVPIKPEYLPGVCLPVVELSTVPTADGTELTAEEAVAMDALNGSPCIVRTESEIDGINLTHDTVADVMSASGFFTAYYFYNRMKNILVTITNESGSWIITTG